MANESGEGTWLMSNDRATGVAGNLDKEEATALAKRSLQAASILMHILQVVLIILFGVAADANSVLLTTGNGKDFSVGYSIFTGVLLMMTVGFAYLMTFIAEFKLGSVAFCLLLTVLAFQISFFTEAFFQQSYAQSYGYITLDIYSMINSLYATAAVLISFGGVIGKTTPLQLAVMTIIELIFYSLNNRVFATGFFDIADCGGTIVIHMFGAYFGLACSWMMKLPKTEVVESYNSDIFSFLGTAFLWAYWPSFVGGYLDAGSNAQQRAITATVLALVGSTSAAFAASPFYSSDGRFRPADIQNATLAGGVAIGAIANLTLSPFTALLVGFVSGHVSTLGFAKLQALIENSLELHDSAGIHNLHGMPSLIGGIASIIVAAYKTTGGRTSDSAVYGSDGNLQALYQFAAVAVTLILSISSGMFAGWIMRNIDDLTYRKFHDSVWWRTHLDDSVTNKHE